MTEERGGKGRGAGRPDLLASLPAEDPPASPPAPGIDPAAIEELLTGMRDLREQVTGLREAVSAERPAPESVPEPKTLTLEALEAWGENLVTRVADAARTEDEPKDDAAAAHIRGIEEAAAKAAAAAERVDGGLAATEDRVAAGIGEAASRIETGLAATRDQVMHQAGLVNVTLEVICAQTAGPKFGWRMVLVGLIVFVLGMLLESYGLIFYRWLRAD